MQTLKQIDLDKQTQLEVDFAIIETKLQLLNLAKQIFEVDKGYKTIVEIYLDLREEVLNIPNPHNNKDEQ